MLIRQLPRRSVFAAVQPLLKQSSQALHCLPEPSVLGAYSESLPAICYSSVGNNLTFPSIRGFAATALEEPKPNGSAADISLTKEDARSILQNVKVQQFREHLQTLSEDRISIPNEELLRECQKRGAASTKEDAERICRSLDSAGVVLRLANQVYLRPEDVAATVIQAVPNTEEEIRAKLNQLKSELEPLEEVKTHVDSRIHRRTKIVIWLALGAFLVQWSIFLRLTFWELSWDVMEPVTYFTSSLFGICTYTYFMGTNREFGYKDATSHLRSKWEEREYKSLRLDPSRHQQLVKDVHRYQRYLAAKAAH